MKDAPSFVRNGRSEEVICACPARACRILSGAIIHVSGPLATTVGYSLPDIPRGAEYIDPLEIALQVSTQVFTLTTIDPSRGAFTPWLMAS